jgi:hypothetical protein
MWILSKNTKKVSSRKQIKIKEVRDDILVLPNNEYRMVIETSSINFELKSDEEQDVLLEGYQNFLNSLPGKLQILVRVREVDVDRYLEEISKSKLTEKEDVYKKQIENYCEFIKSVVSGNKILSRRFYIIIPYKAVEKDFSVIKEHIMLQRDIVMRGLEKVGMKARPLTNLEVLDLFYSFYNPKQTKTQELKIQTVKYLMEESYV